jgi:hypothetical protein
MRTMNDTFDRATLGTFLRTRRAALQPEDVGLRRGVRRRAPGLRREEVAQLCTMSADTSPGWNAATGRSRRSR